jgi:hypothetical protein
MKDWVPEVDITYYFYHVNFILVHAGESQRAIEFYQIYEIGIVAQKSLQRF